MSEEKLYSVKEVLALCHVTRKQLLYYEQKGLISAVRNPENNYRYYKENELFKVDFIVGFRENGFDLASIKEMLDNGDVKSLQQGIKQAMRSAKDEFDKSVLQYERSMERYNSMLEATYFVLNRSVSDIEIIDIPARNIIFHDFQGEFINELIYFYKNYSELDSIKEKYNVTILSPRMIQFFDHFNPQTGDFNGEKQKIRMFYEVKENLGDLSCFRWTEPCRALSMKVTGHYGDNLIAAYQKIIEYAKAKGLKLSPVSIEEELLEPSYNMENPAMWCTQINILLEN